MKTSRFETKGWRRERSSRLLILSLALLALVIGIPGLATRAEAVTDSFTTAGSSTWTAPVGVTSVTVDCWGGGGAGGGSSANPGAGGGGAGGQYSRKVVAVTPGNNYAYTVGAGGVGASGANGGAGADSTFATTVVVAKGGAGGIFDGAGGTGSATGGVGDTVYAGGNGAAGVLAGSSGGGGGGAGSTGAGGNASGGTAGTGTTSGGGTGGTGISAAAIGNIGSQAGGGGSGGKSTANPNYAGGAGGAGRVDITYTPAAADTLSVTANNAVASSAAPLATGVQMQVLTVESNALGDGSAVIASVTIDDLGTVGATDITNLKIHIDSDNNFGNGVLGTVTEAGWNGTSTAVSLTALSAAIRTVANPTAKYIWITYDLAASADTKTIRSSVTAIGVDAPDSGASGTWNSSIITVAAALQNTITSCSGCHAYPPEDSATRNSPEGAFVGDHVKHNTTPSCSVCHVAPATQTSADFPHRNSTIQMQASIKGGSYSRGASFAQSNSPTTGTCNSVSCHGGAASPQWGVGTTTCSTCHALPPATAAHIIHYTAKGWATGSTANCTACHPDNTAGHSDVSNAPSVIVDASLTPAGVSPAITCGTAPGLGCHNGKATPAWNTSGIVCTVCHSSSGSDPADPTSGLHRFSTATRHDNTLQSGVCINCHSGSSPSSLHWNGTVNNPGTATFTFHANVASYTTANGCQASCHSDGGDWKRRWVGATDAKPGVANSPGDPVCTNCHGDFTGWRWNEANASTTDHTDPNGNLTDEISGNHSGCQTCHGWGHAGYDKTWGTGKHGDGLITLNGPVGTGSGYDNTTGGCAQSCHGDVAARRLNYNSGWTANYGNYGAGSCDTCHGYPPVQQTAGLAAAPYLYKKVEDYDGGGRAHVVVAHLDPTGLDPSDGWTPCLPCHNILTSEHATIAIGSLGTERVNSLNWGNDALRFPRVRVNTTFNKGGTATYNMGATTGAPGMGICNNLSCHFGESPKWDCDSAVKDNDPQ